MIIYNVTVKISNAKHDDWVKWMKDNHIPKVMATGKFTTYTFSKILVDDEDGTNYSIQYHCPNMAVLEDYQNNHAPQLQEEHTARYKDQYVAFRTLLEIVG